MDVLLAVVVNPASRTHDSWRCHMLCWLQMNKTNPLYSRSSRQVFYVSDMPFLDYLVPCSLQSQIPAPKLARRGTDHLLRSSWRSDECLPLCLPLSRQDASFVPCAGWFGVWGRIGKDLGTYPCTPQSASEKLRCPSLKPFFTWLCMISRWIKLWFERMKRKQVPNGSLQVFEQRPLSANRSVCTTTLGPFARGRARDVQGSGLRRATEDVKSHLTGPSTLQVSSNVAHWENPVNEGLNGKITADFPLPRWLPDGM